MAALDGEGDERVRVALLAAARAEGRGGQAARDALDWRKVIRNACRCWWA